jgi:myo-inositol-1-phosphate synthase
MKKPPADEDIHIGPSDYIPWLQDQKICFMRIEGRGFGHSAIELELRLSVQDSPNSAGVVVEAIRSAKIALQRKIGGPLLEASAYLMKSPPVQLEESEAYRLYDAFLKRE